MSKINLSTSQIEEIVKASYTLAKLKTEPNNLDEIAKAISLAVKANTHNNNKELHDSIISYVGKLVIIK